jgi:putative ABC transport system substrate-binding protein
MPFGQWKRREVLTLLSGAAATWPYVAHGQQIERIRRVGVLSTLAENDVQGKEQLSIFEHGLRQFGWIIGSNLRIDYRWAAGDADRARKYAAELVVLAPDVIFSTSGTNLPALLQATRSVPIVFVQVADPVGAGFVASMSRPGGNATGFTVFDYGISGKWLELLKEIAPGVTRAIVLRDPVVPAGIGQFGALQSAAPSFGVELTPLDVRDTSEMERAIGAFAAIANGGMVVTGSQLATAHRDTIIAMAARYRLPAVYSARYYVADGGLISYGPDRVDQFRRAASYVDRILRGEKPADLPVQAPTKYELVINLKTAKVLGLKMPPTLIARADEVIE